MQNKNFDYKKIFSLKNKKIVILGGSGKMGVNFSKTLISAGAKVFLGDINSYLEDQKLSSLKELEKNTSGLKRNNKEKRNLYEKHKEIRGTQKKISKIEKQITNLEKEIKQIDLKLEIDYEVTIREPNFFDIYQAKKRDLDNLIEKWEKLQ